MFYFALQQFLLLFLQYCVVAVIRDVLQCIFSLK